MKKRTLLQLTCASVLAGLCGGLQAQSTSSVLFGKSNEWLFTPYEFATPSDAADTQASIQALIHAAKLFDAKGIGLAVAIVPSKVGIHADQLPDNKPLDAYTRDKYANALKTLRDGGVNVIDLNTAFLNSPNRTSDTPLFLRLDTHWSPTGALTAAEAIKAGIDANPKLKAALAATPEVKYTLEQNSRKSNTRSRDLVRLLPPGTAEFPAEQVQNFKVTRGQSSQAGLTGAGDAVGITAIGSSYTNRATGYPDALRYTLQRDLLDISLPVDQGPWSGMVTYLGDEAFKTRPPKLIIWEVPERELRSPPNAKYRQDRYQMDNAEWASRMTSLLK